MQNWPNHTTKLCQEAFEAKLERTAWKFKKSVRSFTSDFTLSLLTSLLKT